MNKIRDKATECGLGMLIVSICLWGFLGLIALFLLGAIVWAWFHSWVIGMVISLIAVFFSLLCLGFEIADREFDRKFRNL